MRGAVLMFAVFTACTLPHILEVSPRGEVDVQALKEDGIVVRLEGAHGTLELVLAEPIPDVVEALNGQEISFEMEAFVAAMRRSVQLLVQHEASGITASLQSGQEVAGRPEHAGEWTWALTPDRDRANFSFYNRSPGGRALRPKEKYIGQLTVVKNDYIYPVHAVTFPVKVVQR